MKKTLFAFLTILSFALLFSTQAVASGFKMHCQLEELKKIDVFLNEELNLSENPVLNYEENYRGWALQIGDAFMDSRSQSLAGALKKRATQPVWGLKTIVVWINGTRTYEVVVDLSENEAELFWWGTAKRNLLANFSCDIVK